MRTESARHQGHALSRGNEPELSIADDGPSISILQTYWSAIDALDANRVALHFAPDAWFQVGQRPPIHGPAAIRLADISVAFENRGSILVPITTTLWHRRNEILACRVHLPQEPGLDYAISGFVCSPSLLSVRR